MLKLLETGDEIRINTIWRMLQIQGYIDGETHKLTPWGQALSSSIKALATEDDFLITALFVSLHLYKLNVLSAADFVPKFSGAPTSGTGLPFCKSKLRLRANSQQHKI